MWKLQVHRSRKLKMFQSVRIQSRPINDHVKTQTSCNDKEEQWSQKEPFFMAGFSNSELVEIYFDCFYYFKKIQVKLDEMLQYFTHHHCSQQKQKKTHELI